MFNGVEFRANRNLVDSKTEEVPRTWKEKLFSLPCRPWKKTKYVTTYVASRSVVFANGAYYAHPDLIDEMIKQLEKHDGASTHGSNEILG